MVGFEPSSDRELSYVGYSVAGAASGVLTRALVQPLDVLKIRFQLQAEPIRKSATSKYSSILQACAAIYREERLPAFWKGHVPAQALSFVYGVVQFTSFEVLTKKVWVYLPLYFTTDLQPVTHFTCGSLSGCCAMFTAHPFDVLRTRFVSQGEPKMYTSVLHAARTMAHTEGLTSFYRGLLPAMLQIAPQTGAQFGFYSIFKSTWEKVFGKDNHNKLDSFKPLLCGSAAGFCAKVSVYPLDMAKKRLQIQGFSGRKHFGANTEYRGLGHCIRTVVSQEGLLGLYKGLSPSLVKAVFSVGINFWTYEMCCHVWWTVVEKH